MRRAAAVVVLALLLLGPVACGGDSDGGGSSSSRPSSGGTSAAVTVEHRYGTTTIDARPERIVSLDTQWTDVLTVLDGPLVGALSDPAIPGGTFPWQEIPESVERISVTDKIPFETVAALQPDLIVISYYATDEGDYDLLSQIAPTIPLLGDAQVNAWQEVATVAGEVLGQEDAAQAMITEADEDSAAIRADLPGLEGRTYALANYVPGDGIWVVADPDDGASRLFAQIGLGIDPDLVALAAGSAGRTQLSLERVGELDADLLLLLTNGAEPRDIPGYANLPSVQRGSVAVLDLATVSGLNTPTPLSVPYSLEAIRPALTAAAG